MIVRRLDDLARDGRVVSAETWISHRLILAGDGFGYSMADTTLRAGTETRMWYKNHVESVYCIQGEGQLEDLAAGVTHELAPGTLYVLDKHDRHVVRATTDLRVVCVFTPALVGPETHDADGAYPLLSPER